MSSIFSCGHNILKNIVLSSNNYQLHILIYFLFLFLKLVGKFVMYFSFAHKYFVPLIVSVCSFIFLFTCFNILLPYTYMCYVNNYVYTILLNFLIFYYFSFHIPNSHHTFYSSFYLVGKCRYFFLYYFVCILTAFKCITPYIFKTDNF